MKPHNVEIKDCEAEESIIIDMEGPYHPKSERIGEHLSTAIPFILTMSHIILRNTSLPKKS